MEWIKCIIHIVVHFVAYLYIMDLINVWKMEHIKPFHCWGPHSCFTSDLQDSKRGKFSEPALTGRNLRVLKLQAQHFLIALSSCVSRNDECSCSKGDTLRYSLLVVNMCNSTSIVAWIQIFTINNSIQNSERQFTKLRTKKLNKTLEISNSFYWSDLLTVSSDYLHGSSLST